MALASFIPSVTGLDAMSLAQQAVSENIANLRTTGYKTNETLFRTLLGSSGLNSGSNSGLSSSRTSICGVDAYNRINVGIEGVVNATGNVLDVAISGNSNAFFLLKDEVGNNYYTRAGDFTKRAENGLPVLVSSGGLYVQGFKASNGEDVFSNTPENIVIEAPSFIAQVPTTKASITANVPANDVDDVVYSIHVYSDNYDGSNLNMVLSRIEGKENAWKLKFETTDGTATASVPEIIFGSDGRISTPENVTANISWNDGSSSSIDIDISRMTQFASGAYASNIDQNGAPSGHLVAINFDEDGILRANYSNSTHWSIAKLAISGFTAPENLTPYSMTLFEANGETGNEYYVDTNGLIATESLESSTVNLEEAFADMIVVQRAYSLNSKSFTVNDEMLSLLIDLKS